MPKRQKPNSKKPAGAKTQSHHLVIFIFGAAAGFMVIVTFFLTILMHDELVFNVPTPTMVQRMGAVTIFEEGTPLTEGTLVF